MPTIKQLLDINFVKRNTSNLRDLKVTLKKDAVKGTGLFATKTINKGNVIAYYKMTVFPMDHEGPTGSMYLFTVYTKAGRMSSTLTGDLSEASLPPPSRGIPYWAYFSNEPSPKQVANSWVDTNLASNYRKRDRVKAGDTLTYKLIASRKINPGEEICWCYSDAYERNYPTGCGY